MSMQILEKEPAFFDDDEGCGTKARALLVHLAENSGILPPSLSFAGIENCDEQAISEREVADVFRATRRGQ